MTSDKNNDKTSIEQINPQLKNAKICLVVVTYNRKKLLEENLKRLVKQNIICDILVIDNKSNDGTDNLVKDFQKKYSNIIYIKLEENVGGAGGFYNGVSKAYELNYDFVVLMDDDGHPINNSTIRNLVELYYKQENKKVMINSIVYSDYKTKTLSFGMLGANNLAELKEKIIKDEKIEGAINPFNGTLLSRELIKDIGFPKREFFISGDEIEYALRAKKYGYKLITAINSEYYHPSANYKIKKVFGKKMRMRTMTIWRRYYETRNYSFINKNYYKKGRQIKDIVKQLLEGIFLSEKPVIAVKYILFGIIDGYKEKFINDKHNDEKFQRKC